MKIKDFLTKNNWTKGYYAHDDQGRLVSPTSSTACTFCLGGAVILQYGKTEEYNSVVDKLKVTIKQLYNQSNIIDFNDALETQWEDVERVLIAADV